MKTSGLDFQWPRIILEECNQGQSYTQTVTLSRSVNPSPSPTSVMVNVIPECSFSWIRHLPIFNKPYMFKSQALVHKKTDR